MDTSAPLIMLDDERQDLFRLDECDFFLFADLIRGTQGGSYAEGTSRALNEAAPKSALVRALHSTNL